MTKYYHVTTNHYGAEQVFEPHVPAYLQKGEDKKTERICVTDNWRHSLRSIILLRRYSNRFYVYSTDKEPVNPNTERERLLKEKAIRKNHNLFRLPPDGQVNKEKWYTEKTTMQLEGMVVFPTEMRAMALMGFGFMHDPDVDKMKLEPYKEEEFMLGGRKFRR